METSTPPPAQAGAKGFGALCAGLAGMIGAPAALFGLGGEDSDPSAGLVALIVVVGLALSIAAIVLGASARSDSAPGSAGLGTAAIVTGILGVLFVAFIGIVLATGDTLY